MANEPAAGNQDESTPLFATPTTKREFGERLTKLHMRILRESGKPNISAIAARLHISEKTVYAYRKGDILPPWENLDPLMELLGATREERRILREAHEVLSLRRRAKRPRGKKLSVDGPRQLPSVRNDLFGRSSHIEALHNQLGSEDQTSSGFAIAVIGTPGAGKTALAVSWAESIEERFPDGQLYIDLRGFGPREPVSPNDALASLLQGLGITTMPTELDARAALYRTSLSGKKILVVLDNARDSDHVRKLLPGKPGSVIVTSRDSLGGLVAQNGVARVEVERLEMPDALSLLRSQVGTERVDADLEAAENLANRCVRLPLALCIAGEIAAFLKSESLAKLADELSDERNTLNVLANADDDTIALRSVFSWSFKHLSEANARAFCLLGLHPGSEIDEFGFAALANIDQQDARKKLQRLHRVNLIEQPQPDRFTMHDLLKAYANEIAHSEYSEDECETSFIRILDYYLYVANTAMNTLYPLENSLRPNIDPITTPVPDVSSLEKARVWVDTERSDLMAAAKSASHRDQYAINYSTVLHRDLEVTGHYDHGIVVHTAARKRAQEIGNSLAEAKSLVRLGVMQWRFDDYQNAETSFQSAIELCGEDTGPDIAPLRMAALGNLSLVHSQQGNWEEAIKLEQAALEISEALDNPLGVAFALTNIGTFHLGSGDPSAAVPYLRQALKAHHNCENLNGFAIALEGLGEAYLDLNMYERAESRLRRALTIYESTGDREGGGRTLNVFAKVKKNLGHLSEACELATEALAIHKTVKNKRHQLDAAINLGDIQNKSGDPENAIVTLEHALELAKYLREPMLLGDVYAAQGDSFQALGNLEMARERWRDALALYSQLTMTTRRNRAKEELLRLLS